MSLRRAVSVLARTAPRSSIPLRSLSTVPLALQRSSRPSVASAAQVPQLQRRWASGGGLTKEDIERRVLEVLQSFDKCDPAKITPTASFTADLGLDSLDAVEVVMAVEEEFSIEIPDEEADKITTVSEAINYIARTPEAH